MNASEQQQKRQGCKDLVVRASKGKEKDVKFLTPEKYSYVLTDDSSQSLSQEKKAQLQNVAVRIEVNKKVAVSVYYGVVFRGNNTEALTTRLNVAIQNAMRIKTEAGRVLQ